MHRFSIAGQTIKELNVVRSTGRSSIYTVSRFINDKPDYKTSHREVDDPFALEIFLWVVVGPSWCLEGSRELC